MRLLKLSLHLLTGFCILFLQYPQRTLAQTHSVQPKERRTMLLSLPSGKMLTVPIASAKEQQYWAEHWQSYADTDSTDAIVMPPGILATMLIPGYTPPKLSQQILDSLALTSSETLPVYYDTTQHFWKTLWEEHRKEYQSGERRIQNIVVVIRKRGGERLAKDSARAGTPDILAIVPLVNARAYKMPPSASDLVFPYLLTNEAHRNGVYSYGGTPLTRLAVHAEKILLRVQLNKIFLPKEGSRSRDTLYSLIAEEMQKNTIQSTRRMVIPESPVITFERLKKTVIRCVVSTGRFFAYPGSFSVKIEGTPKLTDYSIVPILSPEKANAQDQTYAVDLIFNYQIPAGTYKVTFEHTVSMGFIDTVSTVLMVFPSALDARTYCWTRPSKLYYGKRIFYRNRISEEIRPMQHQFVTEYQLGSQKPKQEKYSEYLSGSLIPAAAKKVKISVLWKYAVTGEFVPLFSKEVTPEQTPPDISSEKAAIAHQYSADSSEIEVQVRKIFVDYPVPIDADSLDRPIFATTGNVRFEAVRVDTAGTKLFFAGNKTTDSTAQKILEHQLSRSAEILSTDYNQETAEISVKVRIKKPLGALFQQVPALRIKGMLGLRVSASILNVKAGTSARNEVPIQIPVNIGQ